MKGILVGDKNPSKKPEVREKIRQIMKGKSLEISKRMKDLKIRPPSNKGVPMTSEQKEKIRKARIAYFDRIGRKISRPYKKHIGTEYKIWRKSVFERDKYICQVCFKKGVELVAHHILSWSKFQDKRFDINNGLTLCVKCHKNTENYGNRKSKN